MIVLISKRVCLLVGTERQSEVLHNYRILQYDQRTGSGVHGTVELKKSLKQNDFLFFDESEISSLISYFGDDEYMCFGTCFCSDDFRRSSLAVSRGMIYLLTAITTLGASNKAKSFFDEQCKDQYSDRCPYGMIESDVEDCDLVDSEDDLDDEADRFVLENRKFFCQGFCLDGNGEDSEKCRMHQMKGVVTILPGEDSIEAVSLFEGMFMKEECEKEDCYSSPKSIHCESTSPLVAGVIKRRKDVEKHFDGSKFYNPSSWRNGKEATPGSGKSFGNMAKFLWERTWESTDVEKSRIPSYSELPTVEPNILPNSQLENDVAVTWIGHSTFLVQLKNGFTFLTDPVFSERASPTQLMGPARFREPPILAKNIPVKVDAVLISHNHYDHLDYQSVVDVADHSDPMFFVPKENKKWFVKNDVTGDDRVVEMDWYEFFEFESPVDGTKVRVNFVPSQHWSRRTPFDLKKSLWGGWIVEFENRDGVIRRTYFVGDSGYSPVLFKEIGDEFGPIDFGFVPIGAYEPRYIMENDHVNPKEAVDIARDAKIRKSFTMHHSTFKLTSEAIMEPREFLEEVIEEEEIEEHYIETLKHGETFFFDFESEEEETLFFKEEEEEW